MFGLPRLYSSLVLLTNVDTVGSGQWQNYELSHIEICHVAQCVCLSAQYNTSSAFINMNDKNWERNTCRDNNVAAPRLRAPCRRAVASCGSRESRIRAGLLPYLPPLELQINQEIRCSPPVLHGFPPMSENTTMYPVFAKYPKAATLPAITQQQHHPYCEDPGRTLLIKRVETRVQS